MSEGHNERRIGRRDFFKTVIGGAAALSVSAAFPGVPKRARSARFDLPGAFTSCRIVVFGSDSLRVDYARTLVNDGAPALSYLDGFNPVISSLNGGLSVTQPGWASIWTGLPSHYTRVYSNEEFDTMPKYMHIVKKLCQAYEGREFFPVWITGKGRNICGKTVNLYKGTLEQKKVKGPHWQVKRTIVTDGHAGIYHGDEPRDNDKVFTLASEALGQAVDHDNFCCFIHFKDPDYTGHQTVDYYQYMDKALEVDNYISLLMGPLLQDPSINIIYCSDHGFDFRDMGDTKNHHNWTPQGMLATNFTLDNYSPVVDMCSVGRLIYKLAGGNPDDTKFRDGDADALKRCRMYGVDLV